MNEPVRPLPYRSKRRSVSPSAVTGFPKETVWMWFHRIENLLMSSSIKLAGATWSWVGTTLAESAATYRALGIHAIDLLAAPGKPLDPYEIAADPRRHAQQVRNLGAELSNLLLLFGTDFHDRALNHPDRAIRRQNLESFKGVLEFCVAAGCYSVCVLPGVEQAGYSASSALNWTAEELASMNSLAGEAGVLLVYEPHVESILQNPNAALAFAQQHADIKLVIDYSHGISLGYTIDDLEPLLPYAGHVHLRQAKPGKIQARWDEGAIDFSSLIQKLKQTDYRGFVTIEYEHDPFWEMDRCDVMCETIKMRDAVWPELLAMAELTAATTNRA